MEGARMIVLNRSAEYCRRHELHPVLPVRRSRTGLRPGVRGKGPMGADKGDTEQWRFPKVKLSPRDKQLIIADVVKISTEVIFNNHLYKFGGKVYKQKKGGPIGLRATCVIARLVMNNWDRKLKKVMNENNITIRMYKSSMDDGRILMPPIRPG